VKQLGLRHAMGVGAVLLAGWSEGGDSVRRELPSVVPADLVGRAARYEFSEALASIARQQ
jgi:hypothetical protein